MNGPEWWTIARGAKGRVEREEQKTPHQTAQIGRPRAICLWGKVRRENSARSPHQTALNGRPGANEVGGVRIG